MDFVKNFKSLPSKTRNLMSFGLIVALVVALPLFIWALTNLNFNQKERAASSEPIDITLGEPIIGLPNAAVTIVAYTDFQCPFCKSFVDNTMSTILANYPNDVKFVFKDFPLINTHPLSENAAIAGQCAFVQGMFWEMHDLIFANQNALTETGLSTNFATQLNLDMTVYNSCYSNKEPLAEVQDDMTEGWFKGVAATPTFFINGIKLEGAQPYSVFKIIIDEELLILTPTSTATATSTSSSQPTDTATATPTYVPGEPNSCGGTCGSNYNCKANLYCYQGFCRNPICSAETDCNCSVSATATATSKPITNGVVGSKTATPKPTPIKSGSTAKASAKPTPTYIGGMTLIDKNTDLDLVRNDELNSQELENSFLVKYARLIIGTLVLLVTGIVVYILKKKRDQSIPHITPPTNI